MKKLLALMIVLVLTLSFVGCGGDDDTTVTPDPGTQGGVQEPADDDEEIEIRFSWWGGDSRHEATIEAINMFEEANPNITVVPEYTAWSGHFERISAQLTANDEADLMQINFNWFYNFSPDGNRFVDLFTMDEYLDLSNWPEESYDAIVIDGKLQGVPTSIGSRVYYVNQTPFDEAGIDIPETWDDLMAAGQTFQEKLGPDYYPLGNIGYTDDLPLMTFGYLAQKYGKDIIGEDNEMTYTVEELADGFEFVQALLDNNVIPGFHDDSAEKNHENPNWIQGRYAAVYNWPSSISRYVENLDPSIEPNIVAAPYFKLSDDQLHSGAFNKVGMAFSISPNSDHPEAAAKLLNFLYTDEDAVVAQGLERAVPANRAAEQILADHGMLEGIEYEGEQLIAEYDDMYTFHPFYEDNTVKLIYNDIFEQFVAAEGAMTPEEAAEEIINNIGFAIQDAMDN
ncbi:oligogalacturonide transport system substrate-binding protein [Natranaerovirga hydrolytica]|uniref:Oligogalacturonide transport system substrate-binding protein n=1 Tax=Natranaerovirga hydrolytica TaxID=680378 RepID=A0A4R1MD87_9FIRM|nr:ABC transporter substrate-binding protein [Natranaerovirga hydrolytica]TCK87989.1 oligogalacturonide transport system substrate-binding protein [Natranaerovirga hydrolytica]